MENNNNKRPSTSDDDSNEATTSKNSRIESPFQENVQKITLEFYDDKKKKRIECLNEDIIHTMVQTSVGIFDVSNNYIQRIQKNIFTLNMFNMLEELYLPNNFLKELHENEFNCLVELKILDISNNELEELPPKLFENLINLKELSISNNRISNFNKDQFKNLVNLTLLYISTNNIDELENGIFDNLKSLEDLNISNNNLKEFSLELFKKLTELKKLKISSNKIEKVSTEFRTLEKLENFYLSHNKLADLEGLDIQNLRNLKDLDISHNKLTLINETNFGAKITKTSLERLNLFFNKITSAAFDGFSALKELNLSSNELFDFKFEFSNSSGSLNILNLNNNKIKSLKDISISSEIFSNDETNRIRLNHNNLNDDIDLKWLGDLNGREFVIQLHENQFSDYKIREIEKMYSQPPINIVVTPYLFSKNGYFEEINITESISFPQLKKFKWENIPMFSVLTGENGSGKSSILKYINMELQKNYNDSNKIEPTLPLLIKINDKIEQMVDSIFFKEKLEKNSTYILSKSNLNSKKKERTMQTLIKFLYFHLVQLKKL